MAMRGFTDNERRDTEIESLAAQSDEQARVGKITLTITLKTWPMPSALRTAAAAAAAVQGGLRYYR